MAARVPQASPTRPGKLQRLVGMPSQDGLIRQAGKDVGAELGALSFLRQAEGLQEVALRQAVIPVVVDHPPEQVQLLCTRLVERSTRPRRAVVLPQECRDDRGYVLGELVAGVATAPRHVHLLEDAERTPDRLDLTVRHPPRCGVADSIVSTSSVRSRHRPRTWRCEGRCAAQCRPALAARRCRARRRLWGRGRGPNCRARRRPARPPMPEKGSRTGLFTGRGGGGGPAAEGPHCPPDNRLHP